MRFAQIPFVGHMGGAIETLPALLAAVRADGHEAQHPVFQEPATPGAMDFLASAEWAGAY
jgi:hypothetical protein